MYAGRTLGAKCDIARASQAGWPVSPVCMSKVNPFEGGIPAVDNQDLGKASQSGMHINAS